MGAARMEPVLRKQLLACIAITIRQACSGVFNPAGGPASNPPNPEAARALAAEKVLRPGNLTSRRQA
eukprot:6008363-Pyramimonas_sp.AAC.1